MVTGLDFRLNLQSLGHLWAGFASIAAGEPLHRQFRR